VVSFPLHPGFSLVLMYTTESWPGKRLPPSTLSGFTCYFLGTPGKYPGTHFCRLSVNSENTPLSHSLSYG
jgi:hypothetical protein